MSYKIIINWFGSTIQKLYYVSYCIVNQKDGVCDAFLCTNLSDVFLCTISYFDLIFLALDQFLHHVLQHPSV